MKCRTGVKTNLPVYSLLCLPVDFFFEGNLEIAMKCTPNVFISTFSIKHINPTKGERRCLILNLMMSSVTLHYLKHNLRNNLFEFDWKAFLVEKSVTQNVLF